MACEDAEQERHATRVSSNSGNTRGLYTKSEPITTSDGFCDNAARRNGRLSGSLLRDLGDKQTAVCFRDKSMREKAWRSRNGRVCKWASNPCLQGRHASSTQIRTCGQPNLRTHEHAERLRRELQCKMVPSCTQVSPKSKKHVHALKGLDYRKRVAAASSPAATCKQGCGAHVACATRLWLRQGWYTAVLHQALHRPQSKLRA
jgi:hypothetical protein